MATNTKPKRGNPLPAGPTELPARFLQDIAADAREAWVSEQGREPKEIVVHMNAPQGIDHLDAVHGWTKKEYTAARLGPAEYRVGDVRLRLGYTVAEDHYWVRCS